LNRGQADRAAREVCEQEPKNPDYATTYALSLYLQGDVKKALQALAGFSEAELEQPQIAAYYGVLLANIGDFWRARRNFLIWAKKRICYQRRKARREGAVDGCTALALVVRGGTHVARLDRFL
jgi:hypothetical protein